MKFFKNSILMVKKKSEFPDKGCFVAGKFVFVTIKFWRRYRENKIAED